MTNILIVEPSKQLGQVLLEAFQRKEHHAVAVQTAQDAITESDKINPKLVVLELLIPQHNGLEFIYEFRTHTEWLDVPIVIYSQISREQLDAPENLMNQMGVVEHFYKPNTSLKKLVETAEEILERAAATV